MLHSCFGVAVAIVLNTIVCNIRPTDAGCGDFKGLESDNATGKLYIPINVDVVVPNDGSYVLYSDNEEEVDDAVCREEYIDDGISYMTKGYKKGGLHNRRIMKELVCQDNIHTSRRYVWEKQGIAIGMSTVTFYAFSSPSKSVNIRGYCGRDTIFITRRIFSNESNLSFWNVTIDHPSTHDQIFMWDVKETGSKCYTYTNAADYISPYVRGQLLFIKFKMNCNMTGKYRIVEQNIESSGQAKSLSIHFGEHFLNLEQVKGENKATVLQCTGDIANYTYTWYKDGKVVKSQTKTSILGESLVISPSEEGDNANYSCEGHCSCLISKSNDLQIEYAAGRSNSTTGLTSVYSIYIYAGYILLLIAVLVIAGIIAVYCQRKFCNNPKHYNVINK